MKSKVTQVNCTGLRGLRKLQACLLLFLVQSSLVTQKFYFYIVDKKLQQQWEKERTKEKKKEKKKKANANRDRETKRERERERERVTCESIASEIFCNCVGTWWCGESTNLLTFQFFYYYGTCNPQMCWMKIRIFYSFYLLK